MTTLERASYSICHNDDDPADPNHRRVMIEIFQTASDDVCEILVDGEPCESAGRYAASMALARYAVELLWGDPVWDLRREGERCP
jgi:hypothetical protein